MAIRVVRLGTPRDAAEGLRLGTVRRPPRGVRKEDTARLDHYDVWLPELSPSVELLAWAHEQPFDDARWAAFARKYRGEMARPPAAHLIPLLAALSATTDMAVGCYCSDEARCHRTLLRELLRVAGARLA
jgi:uncharacterized protein YeaO (DUF488 family)